MVITKRQKKIGLTVCIIVLVLGYVVHERRSNATPELPTFDAATHLTPGTYEETLTSSDRERRYLLHIPAGVDTTKPLPLVMFFHGGGGGMYQAAEDYPWTAKADEAGFILVYGQGTSRRDGDLINTWNAGNCCAYARDNDIDDIQYVRDVVADVQAKIAIDADKIFATGFSNGSMMSYRVACELSDTFAAIGAVSGTDNTTSCDPSTPISVIHIHAKDDEAAKFDGGSGRQFEDTSDWVTDFRSVQSSFDLWRGYNGIADESERVFTGDGVTCDLYDRGTSGVAMELCVLETGGHTWPGGTAAARRSGLEPSQALNATDTIWNFFMTYGR
jgi:polyhydroxybutyrate depolymerase